MSIDPAASTNLATARFELHAGARLTIEAGVVTEHRADGLRFVAEEGAEIIVRAGTWLCSDVQPVHLRALPGARIDIGPDGILNGCHLSATASITTGRRPRIGPGVRIWDSNHALDEDTPEDTAAVRLGDFVWLAADVTVLRGVEIGSHSVVGTRSVVTRSIPEHTLAVGVPAVVVGKVGDRTTTEV